MTRNTTCHYCGHLVAETRKSCPKCGGAGPFGRQRSVMLAVSVISILAAMGAAILVLLEFR